MFTMVNFPRHGTKLFLAHVFVLGLNLQQNKFRLLSLRKVRKCSIQLALTKSARFPVVCDVIYQTRERVFHQDIQTPRSGLKQRGAAEFF